MPVCFPPKDVPITDLERFLWVSICNYGTVTIDGKQQKSYGTACRQPDGSWKVNQ